MTNATINSYSDWDFELKILISKNGMMWNLCSAENDEIHILSGLSAETDTFVINDLAIRNGKNGQSIFVTNYPANIGYAEEFSLNKVVNDDLSLRSWLQHILGIARCKLDIRFME